tara:strand:- start:155 stop:283 length:129 start_codon:yes stop_codon:yes gene_type:complete
MKNYEKKFVTLAGFEPATSRAEICYSIQLNYRAIYGVPKIPK